MRLAHYWRPLFGEPAGVSAAIADWSARQAAAGHDVLLLGDGDPLTSGQRYPGTVTVRGIAHRGRGRVARVPVRFGEHLAGVDVLVLHEGWTGHHYVAARAARRAGVPYVVVPHGVHDPEWRAMVRLERARRLGETWLLEHAAAVHLFFDGEIEVVRAVAPQARTLVLPTGVDLPPDRWQGGSPDLLWIGRYSVEHKGLDLLLEALASVPAADRPRIVLRGYDYAGGKAVVLGLRDRLGLRDHVVVGPPVDATEKDELLRACRGWVQPSRWESHSIALLEALSRGVPALVSDRMPISPELRTLDAARVSGLDRSELAAALREFGAAPDAELGARGRTYVGERFAWPGIMARHDDEYGRLAAGGHRAHR